MTWAWKQNLHPTEKYVLIALADHANDEDFTCWPSLTHLQKKTKLSRPTIWKTINRLAELGVVHRVGEHVSGATIYRVSVGKEITQVTGLPREPRYLGNQGNKVGNYGNQVGNQGNKVGNVVTPNHHEPSEPSRTLASDDARGPKEKAKDPIWDTLLAVCGLNGLNPTPSERGAWNKAVQSLRAVNATTSEIQARAIAYRKKWPNVSLTPTALARRWSECVASNANGTTAPAKRLPDDYYLPTGHVNPIYVKGKS